MLDFNLVHNSRLAHVWSNIYYLAPLSLAVFFQQGSYVVVLLLLLISSTAYHSMRSSLSRSTPETMPQPGSLEANLLLLDVLSALLLMVVNLYFWFDYGGIQGVLEWLVVPIILLAFLFYFDEWDLGYNYSHSFWHLFTALITVLILLAYSPHF